MQSIERIQGVYVREMRVYESKELYAANTYLHTSHMPYVEYVCGKHTCGHGSVQLPPKYGSVYDSVREFACDVRVGVQACTYICIGVRVCV